MGTNLQDKKLAFERSELLKALASTSTQNEAAERLGCSPGGLVAMIARHPGLREQAKQMRAAAVELSWAELERAKVKA